MKSRIQKWLFWYSLLALIMTFIWLFVMMAVAINIETLGTIDKSFMRFSLYMFGFWFLSFVLTANITIRACHED